MRVLVVPAGSDASAHLRLIWPADACHNNDLDVRVAGLDWRLEAHVDSRGRVQAVRAPDVDVIVFQRVQKRMLAEAIPFLQQQGVAVVVDVDDDFTCMDPANAAFDRLNPNRAATDAPDVNWAWAGVACRHADAVTVTTAALAARYGGHGRAVVVPNCMPFTFPCDGPRLAEHRIGWTGTVRSHPNDLPVVGVGVARVLRDLGQQFYVVGDGIDVARQLGIAEDQVVASGMVLLSAYYPTVAASLTIGVVPLADTKFNAAKSALKLLELSSLRIPAVVSPTPDNMRLVEAGMGMAARKPKEWHRHLMRLATDPGYYDEVADRSWQAAQAWTVQANWSAWRDAWGKAHAHRTFAPRPINA